MGNNTLVPRVHDQAVPAESRRWDDRAGSKEYCDAIVAFLGSPSRADTLAIPVFERTGVAMYVPFVMFLKRTAQVRLEQPLMVGRSKKHHIYLGFLIFVNLENLGFVGFDAILVQILHQTANRVREVGIIFIAPWNAWDSGFVGIGNALVVF
jgi:hypothetical protein